MLQVKVVPNQRRPGVGRMPSSELRRAWLPQQSRLCPVLEDGSKLGFLVYPPLEDDETFQVRFVDEGNYRMIFYRDKEPVFTVLRKLAGGGGLGSTDELVHFDEQSGMDRRAIQPLIDSLVVNVGGLAGGIGIRGAYDFMTPDGWDTIYTGVLNDLARPHIATLAVRVQTDWFRQPTEFRYAMQNGEGVSASGFAPVGQVFFVPREETTLELASEEEQARFEQELNEYWARKPEQEQYTGYGGIYDHQYRIESRAYEAEHGAERPPYAPAAPADTIDEADEREETAEAEERPPHPSDRAVRERRQRGRRRRDRGR